MLNNNINEDCYGWTGALLRIDLSERKVSEEIWDRSWIGGRAFGQWTLFNEEPDDSKDFDPQRRLIFSSGPLTGTDAPSPARLSISSFNLLSGGISSSNAGGSFSAQMKFAGYDHIIITGKADGPVYIYINDDDVRIMDASLLWGRDTYEVDRIIKKEHLDPDLSIACIGQAGENRVRFGCIIVDKNRAAAWGGNGSLMGSKNLKAIVVHGKKPVPIANPSKFQSLVQESEKKLNNSNGIKGLRKGGSIAFVNPDFNPLSFRNYRDDTWEPGKVSLVTPNIFKEKYQVGRTGCFKCSVKCSRLYEIKEGEFSGLEMEGVQINALRGFGSNLDMADPSHIIKANAISNQYGLNIDGIASVAGWTMDCMERGIITESDLGYRVAWGDIHSFIRLTEDITFRRGFGDILAEGIKLSAKKIGKGSEKLAVISKGVEVNEGRLRSHRAWALGIMTSPRGGGHLNGAPAVEGVGFDDKLCKEVYGIPNVNDPTAYEHKARFVVWTEKLRMLVDSLGICNMVCAWNDPLELGNEELYRIYKEATGDKRSLDELMLVVDSAINIEKAFNTIHGNFSREDDYPPPRLMEEPIKSGAFKGALIDKKKWDKMLDEYYHLHGWDKRTGIQTRDGLMELGMEEVAKKLENAEKLIEKCEK